MYRQHDLANRTIQRRAISLLDMEYRPSELAGDLGIGVQAIYRRYLPAGVPHRRDEKGSIWISGTQFRTWLAMKVEERNNRSSSEMDPNEAYCMKCRERSYFTAGWEIIWQNERWVAVGECSVCGARLRKFVRKQ